MLAPLSLDKRKLQYLEELESILCVIADGIGKKQIIMKKVGCDIRHFNKLIERLVMLKLLQYVNNEGFELTQRGWEFIVYYKNIKKILA